MGANAIWQCRKTLSLSVAGTQQPTPPDRDMDEAETFEIAELLLAVKQTIGLWAVLILLPLDEP